MAFIFQPPTVLESLRVAGRYGGSGWCQTGVTVLKIDGQYIQVRNPAEWEIDRAEVAYLGGRLYTVTAQEKEDLEAAGYEVTTQIVPA